MNADNFFRSAGWLIIGVCFTLVIMSLTNRNWMNKECDVLNPAVVVHQLSRNTSASSSSLPASSAGNVCGPVSFMPAFRDASGLGKVLRQLEFRIGAELEVKDGNFSQIFLNEWKTAAEYVLVNIWEKTNAAVENPWRLEALTKLNAAVGLGHVKKFSTCQNTALACAESYPDSHFDFVFLDLQDAEVSLPTAALAQHMHSTYCSTCPPSCMHVLWILSSVSPLPWLLIEVKCAEHPGRAQGVVAKAEAQGGYQRPRLHGRPRRRLFLGLDGANARLPAASSSFVSKQLSQPLGSEEVIIECVRKGCSGSLHGGRLAGAFGCLYTISLLALHVRFSPQLAQLKIAESMQRKTGFPHVFVRLQLAAD